MTDLLFLLFGVPLLAALCVLWHVLRRLDAVERSFQHPTETHLYHHFVYSGKVVYENRTEGDGWKRGEQD